MLYSSQYMHVHKVSFACSFEEFHFMIKIREVAIKLISYYTAKETTNKKRENLENIFKWCDEQGFNFQNIQTAHTTQ